MNRSVKRRVKINEDTIVLSQSYLSTLSEGFKRKYYHVYSYSLSPYGGGTSYIPGGIINIKKDTKLYAQWVPDTYSIQYDLDGGTVSSENPESYTIESPKIVLVNPTKDNYQFSAWVDIYGNEVSCIPKGSHEDKSLTATYYKSELPDGFRFEARSGTIMLRKFNDPYEITLLSSENGVDWGPYDLTSYTEYPTFTFSQDHQVFYLKKSPDDTSKVFSRGEEDYYYFIAGPDTYKYIRCYGNVIDLIDSEKTLTALPDYAFYNLFGDDYGNTFSFKRAPDLPNVQRLGKYCYAHMFKSTGISEVPVVHGITFEEGCCMGMFEQSSAQKISWKLSAEQFSQNCMYGMFQNCTYLNIENDDTRAGEEYEHSLFLDFTNPDTSYKAQYGQDMFNNINPYSIYSGTPYEGHKYYCYYYT